MLDTYSPEDLRANLIRSKAAIDQVYEDFLHEFTRSTAAIDKSFCQFDYNCNSFISFTQQFEDRLRGLEAREAAVELREMEIKEANQQLLDRENRCAEREKELQEWEVCEGWKESVEKIPTMVKLNVGMCLFTSYLSCLFLFVCKVGLDFQFQKKIYFGRKVPA
jgi:hypothetical protein